MGKLLEKVIEFKYLGSALCKHSIMEGAIKERAVQGRKMLGFSERLMKQKNVAIKVKKIKG